MLSIKMFRFNESNKNSLFRCRTETTLNFVQKKYQNWQKLCSRFVLVQSKHRNSLFRYRTETNILFWIVPKLVFESKLVSKDTLLCSVLYFVMICGTAQYRAVCCSSIMPDKFILLKKICQFLFIPNFLN